MKQPIEILQQYWGFDRFRPLQEEIIQSVLDKRDTLALLPTGGGKSICYQVPALCQEGICIVVSPLIALMKDQVENLQKRQAPAAAIYSGMAYRDIDRILDNCVYGNIKLLYLSPERLTTELAKVRISKMKVNLLAVDEAHCISQWGYDFRPPYLRIAETRELIPDVPILALTATATPEVVTDIQEKLSFRQQHVFRQSFERKNLAYAVLQEEGKAQKLIDILQRVKGSGIVYARNRRGTKDLASLLQRNGISADFYHAGLESEERSRKQDEWIAGKRRIMVSTNAFGMGIDKPDVRVVVHLELPNSLEAYFQEAGRAGRDEQKAYAVLLYNESDRRNLEYQFEQSFPELEEVRRTYRALGSYFQLAIGAGESQSFDFDIVQFAQTYQLNMVRTFHCLKLLEQAGWIVLTESVFIPSSLLILVDKDTLYDYQLRHPKMDKLLKAILRTYQGAFSHPIHLREGQLAKFLKISLIELRKALEKLQQDQIIDYQPQKDTPQIIFVKERVDADNLQLDRKLYEFRKQGQHERIRRAISYAETPVCRSRQLLQYFGESDAPKCGICDVCTGRTQSEVSTSDFERYKDKIQLLLKREPLSLEQIVESFAPKRQEQVLKTLEYLLDEGFLEQQGEKLGWNEGTD
ncbi:MAG: RecQ family ATP-dependent DNA helicase [Phaeodactylibacter sp.]|nr:RecQ family ATP-dependent DNA helicase [Phaeodactylibacter sp.]MCB0595218.1 RecQ family ATP-dependent DNA helicase [Phaeodactylibacter sp.]MCB9303794.1 RecQ family ATP-dependent DNA helicase [Lewinellaceae bacterium]HQU58918.1 ATP-dependent DNA helicase RecQ [Saprospiraceae bacterium]